MTRARFARSFCLALAIFTIACGPSDKSGADGGSDGDGGVEGTLIVTPATATLTVADGVAAQQPYTIMLERPDGELEDVTALASLTIDDARLGTFASTTFVAEGLAGGRGLISASYMGARGQAEVTVMVRNTRVVEPAPSNAADLFEAALEDANRAPTIVYPSNATIVPPNLGDFEVHWTEGGGADLYEVRMAGTYVDLRVYLTGPAGAAWAAFLPSEWAIAGGSERGRELTVIVRALNQAAPDFKGTSAPIAVRLSERDVEGGLYYWAAATVGGAPVGIYRHDMNRPGEVAEQFYTTAEAPSGRCVACHVLSRDGTRMALTYDGGDGAAMMLDVGARAELLANNSAYWNFASFTPDGARILTVHKGAAALRDPDTGTVLATPALGTWISHPDFSPNGDALVFVDVASPGADWHFTGGRLMIVPFDPSTDAFGAPVELHASDQNIFYPSFSPDGAWVVFNRSNEHAYDNASAELWIMKADKSFGPIKLDSPNLGPGLTNSWPRWAPFQQTWGEKTEMPEPFFWMTFSSKRPFGVRIPGGNRPQLWMAPFFPQRALANQDPSAPAFRLPFQNIDSNNHIAQWTEKVVPID